MFCWLELLPRDIYRASDNARQLKGRKCTLVIVIVTTSVKEQRGGYFDGRLGRKHWIKLIFELV